MGIIWQKLRILQQELKFWQELDIAGKKCVVCCKKGIFLTGTVYFIKLDINWQKLGILT